MGADFEDVGGPEGGIGEVVTGNGDEVMEVILFFGVDCVLVSGCDQRLENVWNRELISTAESLEAFQTVPDGVRSYDVDVIRFAAIFLGRGGLLELVDCEHAG